MNGFNGILYRLLGIDLYGSVKGSDWSIMWRYLPEKWILFLIILPLTIIFPYIIYRISKDQLKRRFFYPLIILRILSIAVILVIIFQPVLIIEVEKTEKPYLVFMVDTSASMNIKDVYKTQETLTKLKTVFQLDDISDVSEYYGEKSRHDFLKLLFKNNKSFFIELQKKYNLSFYCFNSKSYAIKYPKKLPSKENVTGIGDSVLQVLDEMRNDIIAGIILFTDGQSNNGIPLSSLPVMLSKHSNKVPIISVLVGSMEPPRDIQMVAVSAPDVAISKDPIVFNIVLKNQSAQNENTVISIEENGIQVFSTPLVLGKSNVEQKLKIEYTPKEEGDFEYKILIKPLKDELIIENNSASKLIKVENTKMNVLYIEGYPRWEYRYLKNAMLRDWSLNTQCILLSADSNFPQESSKGVPPLKEIPSTKQDLFKYDVIILGDVDPTVMYSSMANSEEILKLIKEFVEESGGGLLMLCGPNSNPKKYKNTPLEPLLPFYLSNNAMYSSGILYNQPMNLKLTPIGKTEAFMQLADNPQDNTLLWENSDKEKPGLEGFYWFYPITNPKPSANIFATLPSTEGEVNAILLETSYKRGLVMFAGVDSTWRWRKYVGDKYFYKFWGQSIRHLRTGRINKTGRFQIKTNKSTYNLGDTVVISARAYDSDYNLLTDKTLTARIKLPDNSITNVVLNNYKNRPGEYKGKLIPPIVGPYKIQLGYDEGMTNSDIATALFNVIWPQKEYENPYPNLKGLSILSRDTGGALLPFYDFKKIPEKIKEAPELRDFLSIEDPLWDAPIFIILLTTFLCIEWIIRKINQLI